MAIQFAGSGFVPSDFDYDSVDSGGMPEPGTYLARLVKVESVDDGEHTPSENLTFKVLDGTVKGQIGKQITERLYLQGKDDDKTKKAIARAMAWGKRMGVYTKADADKLAPIEFEKGQGKDFVIEVQADTYEDKRTGETKESSRIGYVGVWYAGHPDAPQCPGVSGGKVVTPAKAANGKPATGKPVATPVARKTASSVDDV